MKRMLWSKFCWADWARDPGLRTSSYAAKGLWMDMLCQMDASPERGFLTLAGRAATGAEIARMVGGERRMVERLIAELEANGVLSRDGRGAIFSRRMTRDDVISRENIANGQRGGNPSLLKNKDLAPKGVNPPLNPELEREEEKKEREESKQEVESASASPPPADPVEPAIIEAKRQPVAKGTRLPADWQPDATDCAFARNLDLDPHAVAPKYRDHWAGKGHLAAGRKSDWPATWRNWCRTEAERRTSRPQGRTSSADNRISAVNALWQDLDRPPAETDHGGGVVIEMDRYPTRAAGGRQ